MAYFAGFDVPRPLPIGVLFLWLLTWAVSYDNARRRERQARQRRRMILDAVADERTVIARELHDLIGHTVNVMLVHAGAARTVLDSSPDQARALLLEMERTGRETLEELDQVLGVLRQDDGARRSGLADLPRLAQRMTDVGMTVTVRVEPPAPPLPRGIDLSAYRIVQEALTNALRHGRATTADVTVRCADASVELDVRDNGRGPLPGYLPGRGLLGIAERAAVFSGTVEHGGGDGGGFRVRSVLPLP
jgi:signal transduction histidine kinase